MSVKTSESKACHPTPSKRMVHGSHLDYIRASTPQGLSGGQPSTSHRRVFCGLRFFGTCSKIPCLSAEVLPSEQSRLHLTTSHPFLWPLGTAYRTTTLLSSLPSKPEISSKTHTQLAAESPNCNATTSNPLAVRTPRIAAVNMATLGDLIDREAALDDEEDDESFDDEEGQAPKRPRKPELEDSSDEEEDDDDEEEAAKVRDPGLRHFIPCPSPTDNQCTGPRWLHRRRRRRGGRRFRRTRKAKEEKAASRREGRGGASR